MEGQPSAGRTEGDRLTILIRSETCRVCRYGYCDHADPCDMMLLDDECPGNGLWYVRCNCALRNEKESAV